jgi:hypothetical protein
VIAKWRSKTAVAFQGDIGQVVMGDVHLTRTLHKQLSAALVAVTGICGWSLYQLQPEESVPYLALATQNCFMENKTYSVGSAMRMTTGEIRECVGSGSTEASHWHVIDRARIN